MKRTLSALLFIAGISSANISYSQWKPSWAIGASIGGVKGTNEAIVQSFNPQFGAYGIWLNGIAPHLSLEAGIGLAKNSSPNQGGYSEYSTSLIPFDVTLRYAPFAGEDWQPYLYAGIGLIGYNVHSPLPANVSADAKLSGITGFFPLGIGIFHPLDDHFSFDCSVGENPVMSDNINPVHDNRNDAFWGFKIGITYSFGNSAPPDDFEFGPMGSVYVLNDVTFDSANAHLLKESNAELEKIRSAMERHPEVFVEFRAYTDDSGDFNTEMALTHDRAESLKVWMVSRGISASHITTLGYGPHNPKYLNDSPEHRKLNCRIEMVRMK